MTSRDHSTRARRTRIVATIGPATCDDHSLCRLLAAGMDAARVNFSHGNPGAQAALVSRLRAIGREQGRPLAVIADLPGPKLRLGDLDAPLQVTAGQVVTLGAGGVPVTDSAILDYMRPGDRVLMDDGAVALTVTSGAKGSVALTALDDGVVSSHKGVNLPDTHLPVPALTARDRELLELAIAAGADHIALSFVRSSADVSQLRAALDAAGSAARIVAKIEKKDALLAIDEIVEASDAVMVARGDLGVEIEPTEVPLWQKAIIAAARRAGRPVITATQMLQSMVASPRPTRAEASDVANAILDSTDALMLSAETAVGSFPVEAVRTMAEICLTVESGLPGLKACEPAATEELGPFTGAEGDMGLVAAVSAGACDIANRTGAVAIVTSTMTGRTTRAVARLRPIQPLIALSADATVLDQLALCWGAIPLRCEGAAGFDGVVAEADRLLLAHGTCRRGDLVVITAGTQGYAPGTTNLVKAHVVR